MGDGWNSFEFVGGDVVYFPVYLIMMMFVVFGARSIHQVLVGSVGGKRYDYYDFFINHGMNS